MQSLFIFSTLFSVAAAQAQVEDKPKTCKTNCVLYLMAATDADFTYMSWCNDAGPRFCEKDAIDCRSSCQTNLNDMHHQNVDCNEVCKFTRRFSSEQSEKPVRQSEAVEEKPAEQSVSKSHDCTLHCWAVLSDAISKGKLGPKYTEEMAFNNCNQHLCHGPDSCRAGCYTNFPAGSVDCNEVCKYADVRKLSAEPAQKAVEEKPVEQSVSKKSHNCDLQCLAVLSDAISKGKFGPKSKYTYEMALHDCQAHLCHGHDSCRSGCYNNFPVGSVDCNALCKYADVRMSAEQSEQKPTQKAVEEKPVEQSVSKKDPVDCDLHCTAVLIDAVSKGKLDNLTPKDAYNDCNKHLCHGPDSCRSGCYTNFKAGSVDCNEVCKYAKVRSAEQSEQKPAQKAVEEKPVEQSVSKSNPSDCDLHCTAVLIDGINRHAFGPKSQYTPKWALHDCMEHLCHGPGSCRSGCYSNFPVGSVDCNEVCKYADVRSALII